MASIQDHKPLYLQGCILAVNLWGQPGGRTRERRVPQDRSENKRYFSQISVSYGCTSGERCRESPTARGPGRGRRAPAGPLALRAP